jgi:hypothetical protein
MTPEARSAAAITTSRSRSLPEARERHRPFRPFRTPTRGVIPKGALKYRGLLCLIQKPKLNSAAVLWRDPRLQRVIGRAVVSGYTKC